MNTRRFSASTAGALTLGALLLVVPAAPASAATTQLWAGWATTGPTSFVVQVANNPAMTAAVATDSRQGQIGIISGASTWLAAGTPVGAKYGSSQGHPYLNLRPKADNPASPSTTTYTFTQPTPTSGWAFVLGDIDADQVTVNAIGPNGVPLTAAQLGYNGGFNYCAPGLVGKPSCTGDPTDIPNWNPATRTLTGNAEAVDTSGSAGWFEPTVPISALTFVYAQRSGLPVFQTWFASLARDITGTVTATTGSPGGATLTLTDANGTVVAQTTSAPDGSYAFPGIQATSGYTVTMTPADGMIATGGTARPVNLSSADGIADFIVREIIPVAIDGTVRDTVGNPVPGATVQLDSGATLTTGPDGTYLFDTAAVGDHTIAVTAPDGYTVVTGPQTVTVPTGSETPITGVDFVVRADPALSGTVTDANGGVAGVVVTATGPSGTLSVVTGADGSYRIPALLSGGYTVSITAPGGYAVSGPASRAETVDVADVTGVDFTLGRTGNVAGTVSTPNGPVAGATLTVTGPDGTTVVTSAADGTYGLGGLPAGSYAVTITPPAGFSITGTATRNVTITAAGEAVLDQDFTLAAVPPPTTGGGGNGGGGGSTPGTGATPSGGRSGTSGTGSTGELADTGSHNNPAATSVLPLVALLVGGVATALTARRRRLSQR